jgi:hypothetical protein
MTLKLYANGTELVEFLQGKKPSMRTSSILAGHYTTEVSIDTDEYDVTDETTPKEELLRVHQKKSVI